MKIGDLAIVTGCRKDPLLIGSVVELFAPVQPNEFAHTPDGRFMRSNALRPAWIVLTDKVTEGWDLVASCHLMPLRGDEQTAPAKREELTV